VGRRYTFMLLLLGAIWGASFMFIKVADRELDPTTLILGRIGLGALTLAIAVPWLRRGQPTWPLVARRWRVFLLLGLLNTALPFWLLTWGETRIDSSLAGIINASLPIFIALLALPFVPSERLSGLRLVGVLVGFGGVVLLVGVQPQGQLLGALAVVGMAFCYAVGGLLASRLLADVAAPVVALGMTLAATLMVLPLGVARAPHELPGWKTIGSVFMLAVLGTGLAYLLYFALMTDGGAGRASLVTYLVPGFAVFYGAIFLSEPVGTAAVVGLALILAGVALATGAVTARRRLAPARIARQETPP
jgi:drug/metabolite transporter (DMT)-like permease